MEWLFIIGGAFAIGMIVHATKKNIEEQKKQKEQDRIREDEEHIMKEQERIKEEQEKQAQREWDTMPTKDKLASITNELTIIKEKAEKAWDENSAILQKATEEYSRQQSKNQTEPEKKLEKYLEAGDGNAFTPNPFDIEKAKKRYETLGPIVEYYASRYMVSACKAKLANDKYLSMKEMALVYVKQLRVIYSKLTEKQKKQVIEDAALAPVRIGDVNTTIARTLNEINRDIIKDEQNRKELYRLNPDFGSDILKNSQDFLRAFEKAPIAASAIFLSLGLFEIISTAGEIISENMKQRTKYKTKLLKRRKSLLNKINKIEKNRLEADDFEKSVNQINISLEKGIEAYNKMFYDIYYTLYPDDDISKSAMQRQNKEDNGGSYFTDKEEEDVMYLYITAKFLRDIVDVPV